METLSDVLPSDFTLTLPEKSSPVLLDIASKLGMSQTDIDDFFIKAKAIVA